MRSGWMSMGWMAATGWRFLVTAVCLWVAGCSNGSTAAEVEVGAAGTQALFAKAKAAEKDENINFFGFYTGMPKDDMVALANHYGLTGQGEVFFEENPETHEVYSLRFTLRGVRRITKGGNSFEELAQAVANRVGTLQHKGGWDGPE